MVLRDIAEYVVAEQTSRLSEHVLHGAKRAIIDWHAALFSGSIIEPTTTLERALADELDHGRAKLASGRRATMRAAALINGVASHAAEVDDVFREAVYHPGSPTISAALAVGQGHGCDGLKFIRAVIVGYEIGTRIGALILKDHYKFWHTTGTVGCLGATAAAGAVLDLDREQIVHALSTATTFAAGLQQAFRSDSMTKPLHAGHAADVGVMSALSAREGVTGAWDILEGPAGFGAAMAGKPDWSKAIRGLGVDYNVTRMTIKNHCCCGQTFAAIDAALALREGNKFSIDDIQSVKIFTYQTAIDVAGTHQAGTASEARFSLPYVVAYALAYGSVRLRAFDESALRDNVVRNLMTRVSFEIAPEFNALFPAKRCARVEIQLRDGRCLRHNQTTRKGDPDSPLSDSELNEKYLELSAPVIGEVPARALLQILWNLEKLPSLDSYLDGSVANDSSQYLMMPNL